MMMMMMMMMVIEKLIQNLRSFSSLHRSRTTFGTSNASEQQETTSQLLSPR
jgi:hypothetical protein